VRPSFPSFRTGVAVAVLAASHRVAAVPEACADVVHLKGGRQLVGRVVEDGDPVRIEVAGGVLSLPRWRVERVERAELPTEVYERARGGLADGDAASALTLATTARELRRSREEGELLALAAKWAPDDTAIAERLWNWQVLDRPVEVDAAATEKMLAVFGEGARLHRSGHWRIAHDVDTDTARACGAMLEATWRAYHRFVVRLGLRPRPVEGRLEALLFADHDDWARATGLPEESLGGLNGLFIGRTGRILLFDAGTGPSAESAAAEVGQNVEAITTRAAELDASENEIADARARVEAWRPGLTDREAAADKRARLEALDSLGEQLEAERRALREAGQKLERYRDRLTSWWSSESVASALHEACHQISFRIGLSRGEQPLWLNEGLATLFESSDPAAIVPEAVNSHRLRDVRRAWGKGIGGDLPALLTGAAYMKGANSAAYAESWALTHFLLMRHKEQFVRFLTCTPPDGGSHAQRWTAAFRAAFGNDLAALEKEWHVYVKGL